MAYHGNCDDDPNWRVKSERNDIASPQFSRTKQIPMPSYDCKSLYSRAEKSQPCKTMPSISKGTWNKRIEFSSENICSNSVSKLPRVKSTDERYVNNVEMLEPVPRVLTNTELNSVITHVVFPSKRQLSSPSPTNSGYNTQSGFTALLSITINETSEKLQDLIPNTLRSIKVWDTYSAMITPRVSLSLHEKNEGLADISEKIASAIASIQSGDFLPFFIKNHNVALIISKPKATLDSSVVISWFEVSADPTIVNSHHKLHFLYPEFSFQVPLSNLLKSKVFAEKLITGHDGTHGIGFVEWLTIILIGSRDPTSCHYSNFKGIMKSIRDEALVTNGFRRSGLWITLKVSLHLCLIEELGVGFGAYVFKLLMIECFYQITKSITMSEVHQDICLVMEILAKLGRKIEKLNCKGYPDETNEKTNPQSQSESAIKNIKENIIKKVITLMNKTSEKLNKKWSTLIRPLEIPNKPSNHLDKKLCSYENDDNYIHTLSTNDYLFGEKRISHLKTYIRQQSTKKSLSYGNRSIENSCSSHHHEKFGDKEGRFFEKSVRNEKITWQPLELKNKLLKYIEEEKSSFKDDPIASSKIILTIFQSLRLLDSMALVKYPLLKQHKLIDLDITQIIEKLLLPTREEIDLATELEIYFSNRNFIQNYSTLISETEPSYNSLSFAIRFYDQDTQMQNLKIAILNEIQNDEAEKRLEIQEAKEMYKELEIKYRNTECICDFTNVPYRRRRHLNYHTEYNCPKKSVYNELVGLTVEKYVYPIPMDSMNAQKSVIFELLIPEEIVALRDVILITWLVLSTNSSTQTTVEQNEKFRQEFSYSPYTPITTDIKSTFDLKNYNSKFYVGRKYINKSSVPINSTSYENNFYVKNEQVKYVFSPYSSRYTSYTQTTPEIIFHMKLETNSLYSNMDGFIQKSTHTQNQVISQQDKANLKLQLNEFIEFGSLRAGHRLQYRNIYRSIVAESLSFHTQDTFALISQAIWQVGTSALQNDGTRIRESQFDLDNNQFMTELLTELDNLTIKTKDNWTGSFVLMTVTTITKRILEFNLTLRLPAVHLLRKCRDILWNWITMIQKFITQNPNNYEDSVKLHLIDTAICGALTFDVSSNFISKVLCSPIDALHWLKFQGIIFTEVKLGDTNLINRLRKNLVRMIDETAHNIFKHLNSIIEVKSEILDDFVKVYMSMSKLDKLKWTQNGSSEMDTQIYRSEFMPSVNSVKSNLSINVKSGEFLINGSPSSKLPRDIIKDINFNRVFGDTQFQVTFTDTNLGRIHKTNGYVKGCSYEFIYNSRSFRVSSSSVIIREIREDSVYELIPIELIRKEIPCLLVEKFSHWWNQKKNIVEFRPKTFDSVDFANPTYILHLNSSDLVEITTRNLLTCIPETNKILHILHVIELSKYILVWKQDGETIAKLPRFGLTFRWEHDHLTCLEYNQMKVIENIHVGTFVGLKNILILEDDVEECIPKTRKLLVPHGRVKINPRVTHQFHTYVEIDITEGILKTPPFFIFEVNEHLKILTAGHNTTAWLYLAALHGATSSPLVDPFTGLTGLEMAMYILQSGHCASSRPYDKESLSILKFISKLSPKRGIQEIKEYGNKEKHKLQSIKIQSGLSSYASFDGYHLIVKKLYEDSQRVAFLYPNITSSSIQGKITVDSENDLNLTVRAYWSFIRNYNKATWIKPGFLNEFSKPPPSIQVYPKNKLTMPNKIKDVHIISKLSQEWKINMNNYCKNTIQNMIYYGGGTNNNDLEGLKPESSDDLAFFRTAENIRDHWIQLYKKALNCNREQWTFILCDLACKPKINLMDLQILHTIGVNRDKFPQPPPVQEYYYITDVGFNKIKVHEIINSHKKSYWTYEYVYYKRLSSRSIEKKQDEKIWNVESSAEISKLVNEIEVKWKLWKENSPVPGILKLNINDVQNEKYIENSDMILKKLHHIFESWENNEKLKMFVQKIESLLMTCDAGADGDVSSDFNWILSLHNSIHHSTDYLEFQVKIVQPDGILQKLGFLPNIYKTIYKSKKESLIGKSSQDIFDYFELESKKFNKLLERLWKRLNKHIGNNNIHLVPGGLSHRTIPIVVFRELLEDNLPEEIKLLIGIIGVVFTRNQRAHRILKYTLDDSKKVLLDRELSTLGHENWIPAEFPEWLILEIELNIMIRDIQVDVAKHMLDPLKHSSVTQLNMGEGKTSVIVPMLVSTLAKSMDACTQVTVLKSLYETNYKLLTHTLGGILNQRVYTFPCARDWTLTKDQVDIVLKIHEEIIKEKGVNLTIPEYRLSWELRSYESAGKDILLCQSLMNLSEWSYENIKNILDESDEILNVKYQKVYAMGLSEKLNEVRWNVAQRVLKSIPQKLSILMKTYTSCIEMNNESNQPSDTFIRCRLLNYTDESDSCYQQLIMDLGTEFIQTEFSTVNKYLQESILLFLTNPTFDQDQFKQLETTCSVPLLKKKFEKAQVVSELLCHPGILQCSLNKRWRVNFGVNPKGMRRVAVPFTAKDVAHEKTEFGHPGMAIVLTQLSYYYSGLNDEQLLQCFEILDKIIENPSVEFDSWINSIELVRRPTITYKSLNLKFPNQRIILFNALRKNMNVIDFWLSHCVYPKDLRTYPNKITCTGWDLCFSKKRTVGFSGTNDMSKLLPIWINQQDLEKLKKTNEEVRCSVEKCQQYQFLDSWIPTTSDVLQNLTDNKIKVLIDGGALMTDMTNVQVAQEWLKINKSIEAVVYFNDKNGLTVRNREKLDCPFELSPFSESLDQCGVYLDDEHTRGTDLKFPDGTIGCVTLGGRMTRDKLVQACMRLRLLQSGHHKLFFLASREAHNQIKSLTTSNSQHIKASDVMQWVCHNSTECQKEGLVFWANSGLNFAKKYAAILNFQFNKNYNMFAKQIQDGESNEETKYTTQENYVETIPICFDSAMSILLTCPHTVTKINEMFSKIKLHVVDICRREIPERKCFSNNLEEEQEREIEMEIELEIQKSRPPRAYPNQHKLDPTIQDFILNGSFNPNKMYVQETKIKGLFASKDFLQVTTSGGIRPVNWVAVMTGKTENETVLLLLSPFEVNELIPHYWNLHGSSIPPQCDIRMFTPRLRGDQSILLNNTNLQLSGTKSLCINTIGEETLAKLHIYAGTMYFDPETDEINSYKEVVKKLQEQDDSFDLMTFIAKNIEQRHQHFPDKCDVYKLLKW